MILVSRSKADLRPKRHCIRAIAKQPFTETTASMSRTWGEHKERHRQGTSHAPSVAEPVLSNFAILSWIALALGVIVLSIMIIARKDIAEAYPPFKSGYEAIGLDFNQGKSCDVDTF